jgi:hypothetical protein
VLGRRVRELLERYAVRGVRFLAPEAAFEAINWPQLVKPRACRSALCCLTACSNPPRENSFNICEKMLHTFIRLSLLLLNWFLVEPNPAYQGAQSLSPVATHSARPAVSPRIWTAMSDHIDIAVRRSHIDGVVYFDYLRLDAIGGVRDRANPYAQ